VPSGHISEITIEPSLSLLDRPLEEETSKLWCNDDMVRMKIVVDDGSKCLFEVTQDDGRGIADSELPVWPDPNHGCRLSVECVALDSNATVEEAETTILEEEPRDQFRELAQFRPLIRRKTGAVVSHAKPHLLPRRDVKRMSNANSAHFVN
jgi:hypothetical protein